MRNDPFTERILERDAIRKECRLLREQGNRIVFTNGCFDILHLGHVDYLRRSAELGDVLVVGLNSDESVRRLKGEGRPIVPQQERATLLAALRPVDYVSIFSEDTPLFLIEAIQPDVLVKGGDYDPGATGGSRYIVGEDVVRAGGGEVCVIDLVEGRSTTNIIRGVLEAYGDGGGSGMRK